VTEVPDIPTGTQSHSLAPVLRGEGRREGRPFVAANDFLRKIAAALHDDSGAAAISFIFCLPIFLTIVGIIVQLALMVNAKIVVTQAADAAARAAMTSLPDEHPENIQQAAWMTLVPICPKSQSSGGGGAEASDAYQALQRLGVDVPDSFPDRYGYAMQAAKVSWSPDDVDFAHSAGQEVQVKVTYRFLLTVPGAMRMLATDKESVAGVEGRFWDVTGTSKVQTSHGRKTHAGEDGWPQ
jgi:hypothetical protein